MNSTSVEPFVKNDEIVRESTATRTALIVTAWVGTLLLSKLPLVIARDFLGGDIPWITPGWIMTAVVLVAATFAWPVLKPLRKYFAIMGTIWLVPTVLNPLILSSSIWHSLIDSQNQLIAVLGDRIVLVLDTLIVLCVLLLMNVKGRDAFLTVGNLNAPVGGQVSTTTQKRRLSWAVLGSLAAVLLAGLFFTFLMSQNPAGLPYIGLAVPWVPLILVCAGLNAFGEEAQFRAAPLATLLPAVGPGHALWLTALWFGLGHYYGGIPSGPFGLVQSGLLALLLGKVMLDTRGMGWSWIIHVAIDTVIYVSIAVTM